MIDAPRRPAGNGAEKASPDLGARFSRLVRDLVWELHPHMQRRVAVTLDSDLDRDLGLDSLGRAELMLRIDRAFKVRLPDQLLVDASTPGDLLRALLAAAPGRIAAMEPLASEFKELPEVVAPFSAATLIEVLAHHVHSHGDRPHIWLWRSEDHEQTISYADLDRESCNIAAGLIERGLVPGDRVAIMLPTELAFFAAFIGVLYAGGAPVPVYPPFRRAQVEDHLRRQAGILRNAGASILIIGSEIRNVGQLMLGLAENLQYVETVDALSRAGTIEQPLAAGADTIALIQYTSGSTGDPKGVVLTHANLLANIRAMGEALDASSSDVFVSWLPLYHDMGLIGAWLGTLHYGVPTVIMPPLAFLADPGRWLRAISRHRATLSAAPNFAFELCCKNVRDEDIKELDLSSLRMLVNGAEPVSPATIARFTARFANYGFPPKAMAPVYGLAENSVGLTFPPVGRGPIVDRVQRSALSSEGHATPAGPEDATALEFVACGRPIVGHEVRIVDETDAELPERTEGRLQFRGPSATQGYFRNDEKTKALFDGEWLESGDRAYIAGGDVFITGRIKDMIIKAGRNIYPHELEELVGGVEGVRKGCVAAFASTFGGADTERLVLLAETRLTESAEIEALRDRIVEVTKTQLDISPDEVVLAQPHTVPKTSSGKLRRSAARTLYESGLLPKKGSKLWWQLTRLYLSGLGHRAHRFRRRVFDLAYAGYWWALLVAGSSIVWCLVLLLPSRRWRHLAIHYGARSFLYLTGLSPKVEVEELIPAHNVLLAVNHSSYLDPVVLSAVIPGGLTFVAKEELAGQRVAGPFLRSSGTLFVRRTDVKGGVEDTRNVLEASLSGERIVSFPEGTLTRMPGLLGFQIGSFLVAAKAGIPVVPIVISGTRSALRGGQWFPRRSNIDVHIGKAMRADGSDFSAAIRLRDAVRARMLALSGEPDLALEKDQLHSDHTRLELCGPDVRAARGNPKRRVDIPRIR
jgi:1-acyl-sn-glycerol-3-phosphate acyltransferase